jgi:anti-anti-sigma factor
MGMFRRATGGHEISGRARPLRSLKGNRMGQDLLRIEAVEGSDGVTVSLVGELDLSTAALLIERLAVVVDARPARLDVDLSQLAYSDSVGLSVFVTAHFQCLDAGIELRFLEPNLFMAELFAVTGLHEVLTISSQDALVEV